MIPFILMSLVLKIQIVVGKGHGDFAYFSPVFAELLYPIIVTLSQNTQTFCFLYKQIIHLHRKMLMNML